MSATGSQFPGLMHNTGAGTQKADRLFELAITGHYRVNSGKLSQANASALLPGT